MAGDWIKMTKDLPDKPEVWSIAGMVGIDEDSVVGKLLRVWSWFDSHTEDGNAVGVTYPLLDRIAGVMGFAEAMAMTGWLHQDGSVMSLPHFERHNGKTAKNRALTNERVGKMRKKQRTLQRPSNADTVTESVSREEKRREEEKTNTPRKRAAASRLVSVSDLVADGVEQQAAEDWLTNRKAKDLPLTPSAWKLTKDEAAKAGLTPAQAVTVAAGNGWAGFKASWATEPARRDAGVVTTVPSSDNGRTAALLAAQAEHAKNAVPPPREVLAALRQAIVRVG